MNPTVALPGSMTWMGIRSSSGSRCPQSPKGLPMHLLNRFLWILASRDEDEDPYGLAQDDNLKVIQKKGCGQAKMSLISFELAAWAAKVKVPCSRISRAARRKAPSAARESALPTLTRLTPKAVSSARLS